MTKRKILRWVKIVSISLLLVTLVTVPTQRVSAQSTNPNQPTPTCETDGDPLTFILCPVYNGIAKTSDFILTQLVVPLLKSDPVSTDSHDPSYQIWSNFRVYGDILLVIGVLIAIYGEVVGGGLIEAYNARKILPRVLVAAILINLSVYIAAIVIDVFNILGAGLGRLLTEPLGNSAQFQFTPSGSQSVGIFGIAAGGTIVGFMTGVFGSGFFGSAAGYVGLMVLLPALFGLIAAFVLIIVRKALILLLILVSPVAFALYVLPNTQNYMKRWWDLFMETMLVYPIMVIIFSVSDILSVTIMKANGVQSGSLLSTNVSRFDSVLAALVAFLALFIPFLAFPFAFRVAGGVLGKAHEFLSGTAKSAHEGIKGNAQDPYSLRNRTRRRLLEGVTRRQAAVTDAGRATNANFFRRNRGRFADQFGNVDARLARYTDFANKEADMMSATGRDSLRYAGAGYMIPKKVADANGVVDDSNNRFFNSKGDVISENEYRRGKQLYGSTRSQVGAGLEYTYRKAQTDKDIRNARFAFRQNALTDNWNQNEAMDTWATATYPHKDKWLSEWYSTPNVVKNEKGDTVAVSFADVGDLTAAGEQSFDKMNNELHHTREGYRAGSMRAQDWQAVAARATEIQGRIQRGTADPGDLQRYAVIRENLDAVARSPQMSYNDQGEPQIAGAPPEAQGAIRALFQNTQQYAVEAEPLGNGQYSGTNRIIYDRAAFVAAGGNARGITPAQQDRLKAGFTVGKARVSDDRKNIQKASGT